MVLAAADMVPLGMMAWPARIETVERLGNMMFAFLDIGGADPVTVQIFGDLAPQIGEAVRLGLPHASLHVLDPNGTALRHATASDPRH